MKKLLTILLVGSSLALANGWSAQTPEQVEYQKIILDIARIKEKFAAMGASRSSARDNAIFQHLKNIGSPVAYKILQEMVARKELPESYLSLA